MGSKEAHKQAGGSVEKETAKFLGATKQSKKMLMRRADCPSHSSPAALQQVSPDVPEPREHLHDNMPAPPPRRRAA